MGGDSLIILRGWEAIETLRGQLLDFTVRDDVIEILDFKDKIRGAKFFRSLFGEITTGSISQVERFSDVNHAAAIVFHQIDTRRFGQGFGLLGELFDAFVHELMPGRPWPVGK